MKNLFALIICWVASTNLHTQCIDSTDIIDSTYYRLYCLPWAGADEFDINPVCGCDSMSYINIQCARSHGISKHTLGGGCSCKDIRVINPKYSLENNPFKSPSIVCGCDGKNYRDPYEAYYKYGITRFLSREACNCIDKSLISPSEYFNNLPFFTGSKEYYGCQFNMDLRVCGCNGVTYNSDLEAIYRYGVLKYTKGSCRCIDSTLIDLSFNCDTNFIPVCGCNNVTYYNASIAKYKFGIIDTREGRCSCYDSLIKQLDPRCTFELRPLPRYVCGCDSITYRDICEASCQFGVKSIAHIGICRCPDQTIIDSSLICPQDLNAVCACDGKSYRNICIAEKKFGVYATITNKACSCRDSNLANPRVDCNENLIFNPVCGCDSVTYRNPCVALNYFGVSEWNPGPCKFKCTDLGLIDTNKLCLNVFEPVCGCDQTTYQNECIAKFKHGIRTWTKGSCVTSVNQFEYLRHQLYPNPSQDIIYLNFFKDLQEGLELQILSMNGELMLKKTFKLFDSLIEIDIQSYYPGLYLYTITDQKGRNVHGRFLKS